MNDYRTLYVKVAGVTFEGRQSYLARISRSDPVKIVPEPSNAYDSNALAVHVAMSDGSIAHVGYVPRQIAAEIAPHLEGESIMASIDDCTGGGEFYYGLVLRIDIPSDAPF